MNDTIRQAVELADGWKWETQNDGETIVGPDMGWYLDVLSQSALDALAAQLVRQVDALGKERHGMLDIAIKEMENVDDDPTWPPDRTMDTITAIVESKVLEKPHPREGYSGPMGQSL